MFRHALPAGLRPSVALLAATALLAGCSHAPSAPMAGVASAPGSPAAPAAPEAFEPYTLVDHLPPKPKTVTRAHRNLQLVQRREGYYLVSRDGRCYQAGRDEQGHLYPVYHDSATRRDHRLYYDSDRDTYYRVGRDGSGRSYRCYEGEKQGRYYYDGRDYDHYRPADYEKPVVSAPRHKRHDNTWLLAIPAAAAAYVLLGSHHTHHRHPAPA